MLSGRPDSKYTACSYVDFGSAHLACPLSFSTKVMTNPNSPGPDRPDFESVIAEYQRQLDQGQHVEQLTWLEKYPQFSEQLREYFAAEQRDFVSKLTAVNGMISQSPESGDNCFRRLGNYELIRQLGRGGMGDVYLARHHKFRERIYAIKLLKPNLVTEESRSRFENEINVTGKLQHPNIVYAFDAGRTGNESYLVMEFLRGCDLQSLLMEHRQLSVANACEMIRQAATGLDHAVTQAGLIHRDVKPANLMLTTEGDIKVLDMGLARLREQSQSVGLTREGQVLGTPDYMAPEQWSESSEVATTADVYSLACTLFALLTGKPPFYSKGNSSLVAKMKAHVTDPVPEIRQHRKDVPHELAELIQRCLAKESGQRCQTPGELAEALQPFCENADLSVYETDTASLLETSFVPTERLADGTSKTMRKTKLAKKTGATTEKRVWFGAIIVILLMGAGLIFTLNYYPSKSTEITEKPGTRTEGTEVAANRIGDDLVSSYGRINSNTPEGQVVFEGERSRIEVLFPEKRYFLVLGITPQSGDLRVQSIWPVDDRAGSEPRDGFRYGDRLPDQLELDYRANCDIAVRGEGARGSWLFSDGPGLHAFLVISSRDPLPAFSEVAPELREHLQSAWPASSASPKHWKITNSKAFIHEFDRGSSGMLRGPDDSDGFNMQSVVDDIQGLFPDAFIDGLVFNVETYR